MTASRIGNRPGETRPDLQQPPAATPTPYTEPFPETPWPQPQRVTRQVAITSTPPPAVVVLNRAAFGPKPGQADEIAASGVLGWLQQQLDPASINDSECDAILAAQGFLTLTMSIPNLYIRLNDPSYIERDRAFLEVRNATILRAVHSKRQLFEVIVAAWHQHFNVYGPLYPASYVFPDYDARIRRHAFGNFKDFLFDIATSPAMLWYLDNSTNFVEGFNENYARELFELHTMGVTAYTPGTSAPDPAKPDPGYRDWDVYDAARCFTGWTVKDRSWDAGWGNTGEFTYRPEKHDKAGKYVLGKFIATDQAPLQDGRDVLDRLARHPATAKNVATRLVRRLISDTPPAAVVNYAAAVFTSTVDAPDQLKQVIQAIVTHAEFQTHWGEKVKRPFEVAVGAIRSTNATFKYNDSLRYQLSRIGHTMFEWSPPNGYPDIKDAWTSSTSFVSRWNMFTAMVGNSITDLRIDAINQTPASLTTPRQVVDYWVKAVMGYQWTDTEKEPLFDFMARGQNLDTALPTNSRNQRLGPLIALILSSPANQLR